MITHSSKLFQFESTHARSLCQEIRERDDDSDLEIINTLKDEFDIEEYILKKETLRTLEIEIDNLPLRYKTVMKYRLKGMTFDKIGKLIGISQPQVGRDYQKALNILRYKFEVEREEMNYNMRNLSAMAKVMNKQPKPNSKRQQELKENPKKYNVIGCKVCGATNIQLIKATDSYYCKFCFDKLGKKKFEKKGRK